MARTIIDPTPVAYDDLRSEHRSNREHATAAELLKRLGVDPGTARFRRYEVTTDDLIESIIIESQLQKRIPPEIFDYRKWRSEGPSRANCVSCGPRSTTPSEKCPLKRRRGARSLSGSTPPAPRSTR